MEVQAGLFRDNQGADSFTMMAYATTGDGELLYEASSSPAEWSEDRARGSGPIVDKDGNPTGETAAISFSFAPAGEPTQRVDRVQEGNQRLVVETSILDYTILTHDLSVGGYAFGPMDCDGGRTETHTTSTTPAVFTNNDKVLGTVEDDSCSLPGGGDIYGRVDGRRLTMLISELPGDLDMASGTIALHGVSGTGTLALTDDSGTSVGTAETAVSVTKAGVRTTETIAEEGVVVVRTVTPYRLGLSVSLPDGQERTTCDMELVSSRLTVRLS
ncbi:hypothetical protein [Streptomyces werraensis]|uniref:hypothetical protein n=1 Tax=Streptomyces werraensis TaxID=68284 RepID=UPI001CE2F83E